MSAISIATPQETRIDANGTAWRLRSLIAMGHSPARLARALGTSPATVHRVIRGQSRTVTPSFRDLACQLWDAWWCYTPPQATSRQRAAAAAARHLARQNKWPCPLALDEPDPLTGDSGMDAPGYRPYSQWRPATGIGIAPDFHPAGRAPVPGSDHARPGDANAARHGRPAALARNASPEEPASAGAGSSPDRAVPAAAVIALSLRTASADAARARRIHANPPGARPIAATDTTKITSSGEAPVQQPRRTTGTHSNPSDQRSTPSMTQPPDKPARNTYRTPEYVIELWATQELRDKIQRNGRALYEALQAEATTAETADDPQLDDLEAEP